MKAVYGKFGTFIGRVTNIEAEMLVNGCRQFRFVMDGKAIQSREGSEEDITPDPRDF